MQPVSVAEGKTVPEMFHSRVQLSGDGVALRYKKLGIWHDVSWKEYGRRVREVCMALLALGLKPGECVSVIGENSPEWVCIDLGTMHAGGTTVGVYATNSWECIGCGACAYVCPTGHIKLKSLEYEKGALKDWYLGSKTAIYVPTMQAVPRVPRVDEETCINKITDGCKVCSTYCEPGAIDYEMKDEVVEVEVGQILLTTGFQLIDLSKMAQYGYGRYDNVHSSLEFEHMLNSTGPTGGQVVCKDGSEPRAVGIIHCIGSRDENYHKSCSRVCCMYALKFSHLIKVVRRPAVVVRATSWDSVVYSPMRPNGPM